MKPCVLTPAVLALAAAIGPQATAAATLQAFAGIELTVTHNTGGVPVNNYRLLPLDSAPQTDTTDGDGVNTGGVTAIATGEQGVLPPFVSQVRVDAESRTSVEGEARFRYEAQQRFSTVRSATEDRSITIELAALPGLDGEVLFASGESEAPGDLGRALARITLEREGFEGTMYSRSIDASLLGTSPGDTVSDQFSLGAPVEFFVDLPATGENVGETVIFSLTLAVETSAISSMPPSVIPLPPAAPLLALGLGCLALLRCRPGA